MKPDVDYAKKLMVIEQTYEAQFRSYVLTFDGLIPRNLFCPPRQDKTRFSYISVGLAAV